MTDVRLDRSDEQWAFTVPPLAVDRSRRVQLNWVTELRAGGVRFQIVDIRWRNTGLSEGVLHRALLGRAVRHREPRARSVLIDRGPSYHRPDAVTVGLGVT